MSPHLDPRQLWEPWTRTAPTATLPHHCTPFTLPSNGVIALAHTTLTLTTDVLFRPQCTGTQLQDVSSITGGKDPFYASTIPQTYAIASATVIAWILVIMLVITPRTNFLGGSGTAPGFSSGHGIIGGATGGNTNLIGVGSRPWLQMVAALTVAISLTIATADTFRCAQQQYVVGYMDATSLREEVLGSLEIRITRVISDVFVWLAQVQTLIRLFPRHKEKVLIKWIGFALILFDSLFSCLNSFMVNSAHSPPRQFVDAIPALSYLFELALGLLYAAWVIYYSLTKRRYAFYHTKMPSISLIALLSLVAVLTPVVFFVTDVSNQDVAGWGDYFRWVGAAAASVVVWEWVERIEALERDEKKDGILGREIFDGDEMLDVTPSDEVVYTNSRYERNRYRRDGSSSGDNQSSALEKGISSVAQRFRRRTQKPRPHFPLGRAHSGVTTTTTSEPVQPANTTNNVVFGALPKPRERNDDTVSDGPTPPPMVASPVSRADTTSAASTVYVVQYNPSADIPQPVRRRTGHTELEAQAQAETDAIEPQVSHTARDPEKEEAPVPAEEDIQPNQNRSSIPAWLSVTNPFKRKRASPPAEVQQARRNSTESTTIIPPPTHNSSKWDVKNRLGVLAAETGDKWRDRSAGRRQVEDMPVTIIPAQPRGSGRTWTPPVANQRDQNRTASRSGSVGSSADHIQAGGNTTSPAHASTSQRDSDPPRNEAVSPFPAAGGARNSIMSSESSRSPPPRADEIRPVAGTSSPTIIPAPRRSVRSSPLAVRHEVAQSSPEDHEEPR